MTVKELKEYLADKDDAADIVVYDGTINSWVHANRYNFKIME